MSTVKCEAGQLQGSLNNGIHAFKGIPYAEPVGGRARWLAPRPRAPWQGVRDAREYGPACMQFTAGGVLPLPRARRRYLDIIRAPAQQPQGDDCLLLNVWTPTLDTNARLPVMVYIHGGSFTTGSATAFYDATRFAANGVVAVTIQYRLGPAGFLHGAGLFDDGLCADNRGFLDQICALQWVRDNIAAFGGDPTQVTVFGESAGAFAVFQLAASPPAKGLFRRAIAMGGMAETSAPAQDYYKLSRDALRQVGVKPGDGAALAALGPTQLRKVQTAIRSLSLGGKDPERYGAISRYGAPFLGAAEGGEFLPLPALERYRGGTPNNVDLMLGTCRNDGGLFSIGLPIARHLNARLFSRVILGLVPQRDMAAVRDHYLRHVPGLDRRRVQEMVNNDAFFGMPTLRAAEAHAVGHPGRTWYYRLDCPTSIPELGAMHGVDVALLFRTTGTEPLLNRDALTEALSDAMLDAWVNFARIGRPATALLPEWQPFDAQQRATMVLDRNSRLELDPEAQLRQYWTPLRSAA